MKKWVFTNSDHTKGAIVFGEDFDLARKEAFNEFYGAYRSFYKNDLSIGSRVSDEEWEYSIVRNKIYKHVAFNWLGGVSTAYNTQAYAAPSDKQAKFIGNNTIQSVIFYNTDTPQGNYGDKIGNK